jgi:DNA repair protein RecN (Recombination protein N)
MLTCLKIRSFAIIDALEVDFGPGLNVVTGETGAGKSILVDALGLVLGEKARPELVRTGAPQAEVEALFDLSSDAELCERLRAAGIDTDGELVVRRIVSGGSGARSRAYVNGVLTTQSQLAELAAGLVDVSSQHEHQTLVDPVAQLEHLDAFARLGPKVAAMREAHAAHRAAEGALREVRARVDGRAEREDFLRYQQKELDELAPRAGEIKVLEVERERLRHAEKLIAASSGAEEALYARDGSVSEELSAIAARVQAAADLDASLSPMAQLLETARAQIEDAARELGAYGRSVSLDPERLSEVEERLHRLQRLSKKHGVGLEADPAGALESKLAAIRAELSTFESSESVIEAHELETKKALRAAQAIAAELTKKRTESARILEAAVTNELRALGMSSATLSIQVAPVSSTELGPTGADRIEFLFAPNAGEEARPMRRIASGGELSRTMLALKHSLAGLSVAGLSVFDEVDTGVGGAVAEVMGRKIAEVARHHQVLCVTHLAPIAVYADRHFVVQKLIEGGRTKSTLTALAEPQRVEEIARMIGGITVTQKTREAAQELLDGAAAGRGASTTDGPADRPGDGTPRTATVRGGKPRGRVTTGVVEG